LLKAVALSDIDRNLLLFFNNEFREAEGRTNLHEFREAVGRAYFVLFAEVAQSVEQLFCKQRVGGSIPFFGLKF
jgi:hypothetical protein